jgi:uncharacterized protein YciI
MSAYQRFLPRDGTRRSAYATAEVAEAAEVQAHQRPATAEALLKPAEVRLPDLSLQQASAVVQQRQALEISELQQLQQFQQQPAPTIAGPVSDLIEDLHRVESSASTPAGWTDGVALLRGIPPPRAYPAHAWQHLIADAETFLDRWAATAYRLGWPGWELFGCHRRAPWYRIDGMGLVLLLDGASLAALTATEAVIRTASGAHQTRRRKPRDPLTEAERCLIWELA